MRFIQHSVKWSLYTVFRDHRRFHRPDWHLNPYHRGYGRVGGYGGFARGRMPHQRMKYQFASLKGMLSSIQRRKRRTNPFVPDY